MQVYSRLVFKNFSSILLGVPLILKIDACLKADNKFRIEALEVKYLN
jgi:hypothetical protein